MAALIVVAWGAVLGACESPADGGGQRFLVNPDSVELEVGGVFQLSVRNAPGPVTWSSSNSGVATVIPETGHVTAISRGEATVTAVSGTATASARIIVKLPPGIALSADELAFEMTDDRGDPGPESIQVGLTGDGTLNDVSTGAIVYGTGQPTGWLSAQLSSPSPPSTLEVRASGQGLPAGFYTATVPVTSARAVNAPLTVSVGFRIFAAPSIVLSRTEVPMAGIPGAVIDEIVQITNGGERSLEDLSATVTYGAGPAQGWLEATLNATTAPATLSLRGRTQGLEPAAYQAVVRVATSRPGVEPRDITVNLTVTPGPAIQLSETTVAFAKVTGGADPAPVTIDVSNGGGGSLTGLSAGPVVYQGAPPSNWLTAELSGSVAPTTIQLSAAGAGLPHGSYSASVPVASDVASNSPLAITVTFNVTDPPVITLTPNQVSSSTFRGGNNPPALDVEISATGGQAAGLAWQIDYGLGPGNWISASTVNNRTETPAILRLQPLTGSRTEGAYNATVTVTSTTAGVVSKTVAVTFVVRSFTQHIYPLVSTDYQAQGFALTPCTGCHKAGSTSPAFDGTAQAVYDALRARVSPPDPNAGVLVCKITAGSGCGSAMPLPDHAVQLIKEWISRGAPFQ